MSTGCRLLLGRSISAPSSSFFSLRKVGKVEARHLSSREVLRWARYVSQGLGGARRWVHFLHHYRSVHCEMVLIVLGVNDTGCVWDLELFWGNTSHTHWSSLSSGHNQPSGNLTWITDSLHWLTPWVLHIMHSSFSQLVQDLYLDVLLLPPLSLLFFHFMPSLNLPQGGWCEMPENLWTNRG